MHKKEIWDKNIFSKTLIFNLKDNIFYLREEFDDWTRKYWFNLQNEWDRSLGNQFILGTRLKESEIYQMTQENFLWTLNEGKQEHLTANYS